MQSSSLHLPITTAATRVGRMLEMVEAVLDALALEPIPERYGYLAAASLAHRSWTELAQQRMMRELQLSARQATVLDVSGVLRDRGHWVRTFECCESQWACGVALQDRLNSMPELVNATLCYIGGGGPSRLLWPTTLQTLRLKYSDEDCLHHIAQLPELRRLELLGHDASGDEHTIVLPERPRLPKLAHLHLYIRDGDLGESEPLVTLLANAHVHLLTLSTHNLYMYEVDLIVRKLGGGLTTISMTGIEERADALEYTMASWPPTLQHITIGPDKVIESSVDVLRAIQRSLRRLPLVRQLDLYHLEPADPAAEEDLRALKTLCLERDIRLCWKLAESTGAE